MTGQSCDQTAQPPCGAVPLSAVDDRQLIADLVGPAVTRVVEHLPVATLLDASAPELASFGLAPVARRRLLAAAELARRFQPAAHPPPAYHRPWHFLPHLASLRTEAVEILGVFLLDARLALLDGFRQIARGGVMHVTVSPREVFAPAIERHAAGIVLAHNHPAGDSEPSEEDLRFTRRMVSVGGQLDIIVLDHLIVARRSYFSFLEGGLLLQRSARRRRS